MTPRAAKEGAIPVKGPTITPFSAINDCTGYNSNLSTVTRLAVVENKDKTPEIALQIPESLRWVIYERSTTNVTDDHCLPRLDDRDDQLPTFIDSSKTPREQSIQTSNEDECDTKPDSQCDDLREHNDLDTMKVLSISEAFGVHAGQPDQEAASNCIPLLESAIAGRNEQTLSRPGIEQPQANKTFEDVLLHPSTVNARSDGVQSLTKNASHIEINNLRSSNHEPENPSTTKPSGSSDIILRKRKASQGIEDQNPTARKNLATETRAIAAALAPKLPESIASVQCDNPPQIRECVPQAFPSSSPIVRAPAPGISASDRKLRKVKPEIYVRDRQGLWNRWPYGYLRDHTVDTLLAKIAQEYELPPEQVYAVQFTFPDTKDQASIVVSREELDSFRLLHEKVREFGKICRDKESFRIHADPRISENAESDTELEKY